MTALRAMPSACRKTFGFPMLVPRKLETAQNRKVWAARAKPVLPTNYIFSFIDRLITALQAMPYSYLRFAAEYN